jgi:hypothetical protein
MMDEQSPEQGWAYARASPRCLKAGLQLCRPIDWLTADSDEMDCTRQSQSRRQLGDLKVYRCYQGCDRSRGLRFTRSPPFVSDIAVKNEVSSQDNAFQRIHSSTPANYHWSGKGSRITAWSSYDTSAGHFPPRKEDRLQAPAPQFVPLRRASSCTVLPTAALASKGREATSCSE